MCWSAPAPLAVFKAPVVLEKRAWLPLAVFEEAAGKLIFEELNERLPDKAVPDKAPQNLEGSQPAKVSQENELRISQAI